MDFEQFAQSRPDAFLIYKALDLLESSTIIERMEFASYRVRIDEADDIEIYQIINELRTKQKQSDRFSMTEINTMVKLKANDAT